MNIPNQSSSEYRGGLTQSYVNAAKRNPTVKNPSRDQAIIMTFIDKFKIVDYAKATATLVGAKNITHISRISNNRICIFLSSKDLVDKFLSERKSITIENEEITVRKLISPKGSLFQTCVLQFPMRSSKKL